MNRCPICYARTEENSRCARCGADLNLLLAIEKQSIRHTECALYYLLSNDIKIAQKLAKKAYRLQSTAFNRLILRFCEETLTLGD